jgi:hypothetical protein
MKDDTITTFFMNISDIKYQLGAIGETITDRDYSQCPSKSLGTIHSKYQWKRSLTSV